MAEYRDNILFSVFSTLIENQGKFNDDFKQPCIVFASHPSLRFGDVCHLVELWKTSNLNSFVFVETEFNYLECLAPYQPIYANYYYFPIETSFNAAQSIKLLKEAKHVAQIVTSELYSTDPFNLEFSKNFGRTLWFISILTNIPKILKRSRSFGERFVYN